MQTYGRLPLKEAQKRYVVQFISTALLWALSEELIFSQLGFPAVPLTGRISLCRAQNWSWCKRLSSKIDREDFPAWAWQAYDADVSGFLEEVTALTRPATQTARCSYSRARTRRRRRRLWRGCTGTTRGRFVTLGNYSAAAGNGERRLYRVVHLEAYVIQSGAELSTARIGDTPPGPYSPWWGGPT